MNGFASGPTGAWWLVRRMNEVDEDIGWLTQGERQVLAGLEFPKRREDWLLGRRTAKEAVRAYLARSGRELSIPEIEIRAASDGAPEAFHRGSLLPLRLSLSHREGVGVCTVTGPDVSPGCDIERIEPRSDAFIRDYLNLPEQAELRSAPRARQELLANLFWSAKEAALKVLREGLRQDPLQWAVVPRGLDSETEGLWSPLTVEGQGGLAFQGWWQRRDASIITFLSDPAVPRPSPLDT